MESALTLNDLVTAIASGAPAIRSTTRLQPAGGPGDKVFPPTYVKDKQAATKYAFEKRVVDGEPVDAVLLDSVASQANRIEEALLEAWKHGKITLPVVQVDFSSQEGLQDLQQITALQAPHRIADAILRDSVDADGTPFRLTAPGIESTDARVTSATGMYKHCPTALIFGVWDSTGPKGGLGSKFQRCLVSEIVGLNAVAGVKTASRIDPAGIERKAGIVYESKADPNEWTSVEDEANKDSKGEPKPFDRKGKGGDKGTPAKINHGNIPPSIEHDSGGVTMSHAMHTAVLSLAGLKRLRFPTRVDGSPVAPAARDAVEAAARVALAATALAGLALQRDYGYDLRSRSLLVPTEPFVLEILDRDGGEPIRRSLAYDDAVALQQQAVAAAAAAGMGWSNEPVTLTPAPKLAALIRGSRALTAAGEVEET